VGGLVLEVSPVGLGSASDGRRIDGSIALRRWHARRNASWSYNSRTMESPQQLYHYTTVQTLEKILQSRTFKFNRLDKVNDPLEGQSVDRANLGMYVFVSCWTANERPNPTLWQTYADAERGVRIRMPSEMFKRYVIAPDAKRGINVAPGTQYLVPIDEIHGNNFTVGPIPKDFLVQMLYTEDPAFYRPQVSPDPHLIQFGKIGICKRTCWSAEEEWRFRFWITPAPPPPHGSYADSEYASRWEKETLLSFNRRLVQKEAFFLALREEAFRKMQVHLGPKQAPEDRLRARRLIARYDPDADVVE
jgi:hypothetical protein